jgi:hypothetical protein
MKIASQVLTQKLFMGLLCGWWIVRCTSLWSQADFAIQGLWGNMVSHSVNNKSMAGSVGGVQGEMRWFLSESQVVDARKRFVGCALYGFDMGDGRREREFEAKYGEGKLGDYALGGQAYSVIGIVGEQISMGRGWQFRYQWGTGVSWNTKYFDVKTNPKNLAISTPLNFAGQLRVGVSHQITDHMALNIGGNISHFSNANYRKPNVGYNIVHGHLGVIYQLKANRNGGYWQTRYDDIAPSKHQLGSRFGYRMESMKKPGYFPVAVIEYSRFAFDKSHELGVSKHEWRWGLNGFYQGRYGYVDTFSGGSGNEIEVAARGEMGAFLRHLFRMGRFDLLLDLGVYLHRPLEGKTQFYNCLGFQYRLTDRWILQQRLKAHLNNADYLEWGMTYCF